MSFFFSKGHKISHFTYWCILATGLQELQHLQWRDTFSVLQLVRVNNSLNEPIDKKRHLY